MWKLLFPSKCVVCHRVLKEGYKSLCERCEREMPRITEPRCRHCSKPLWDLEKELCGDCEGRESALEEGIALYEYDAKLKQSIQNFKYHGELSVGDFFAKELVERYGEWIRRRQPDLIVPVPVHRKRKQFRGFNQADYIAHKIGEQLQIPVSDDYLIRTINTKPQKELDNRLRVQNLRRGMAVRGRLHPKFQKILLVDDIYTTGATLEACASILHAAGAEKIYFSCVCIGNGQ